MPEWPFVVTLLAVGLAGGALGGFLGIGGSVLFIPVLTVFIRADYHTAQAAALVVNVCVGASAARAHLKSGRVSGRILRVLIPCSMAAAVLGVLLSNRFTGEEEVYLRRLFGLAMIYVIAVNLWRMVRRYWLGRETAQAGEGSSPPLAPRDLPGAKGLGVGLVGGAMFLGLPLKTAVANSSAAIIFTCILAAAVKHMSLASLGVDPARPWLYVGLLAPTAVVGAAVGSYLTHRVSRERVRVVFVLFLAWAAYKMLTA
jgi:uncharacterized membrane protein YfcA